MRIMWSSAECVILQRWFDFPLDTELSEKLSVYLGLFHDSDTHRAVIVVLWILCFHLVFQWTVFWPQDVPYGSLGPLGALAKHFVDYHYPVLYYGWVTSDLCTNLLKTGRLVHYLQKELHIITVCLYKGLCE